MSAPGTLFEWRHRCVGKATTRFLFCCIPSIGKAWVVVLQGYSKSLLPLSVNLERCSSVSPLPCTTTCVYVCSTAWTARALLLVCYIDRHRLLHYGNRLLQFLQCLKNWVEIFSRWDISTTVVVIHKKQIARRFPSRSSHLLHLNRNYFHKCVDLSSLWKH